MERKERKKGQAKGPQGTEVQGPKYGVLEYHEEEETGRSLSHP